MGDYFLFNVILNIEPKMMPMIGSNIVVNIKKSQPNARFEIKITKLSESDLYGGIILDIIINNAKEMLIIAPIKPPFIYDFIVLISL